LYRLVKRIRYILSGAAGETLIEGIASILVFVVLVAAVTMMILVSMRITAVSTENARIRQIEAAAVLAGDEDLLDELDDPPDFTETAGNVTFNVPNTVNPSSPIPVTIPVTVFSTDAFTAFEPEP
jgi:Tfp pilus assembly protein PilX